MGLFIGNNLVSLAYLDQGDALRDWRYTTLENGTKLLEMYMRKDENVQVLNDNTIINRVCFMNDEHIKNLDLMHVPYYDNKMNNVFAGCYNIVSVTNINENVTDMRSTFSSTKIVNAPEIPNSVTDMTHAFYYCSRLVNAPVIPNSVTNMQGTFYSCTNLINAPVIGNNVVNMVNTFMYCSNLVNATEIPDSVTNMSFTFNQCSNLINIPKIGNSVTDMHETFFGCFNLVNAPVIPNSVTNMQHTFRDCHNLVNAPEIPNSVTDMIGTFCFCYNLAGDIYIHSGSVKNSIDCFLSTSLQKNVYIPFKYNVIDNMYAWHLSYSGYNDNYPQFLYTKTESPLTNTEGQVFYANGTPFTVSNIIESSNNSYINFGDWYTNYSRYASYDIINGSNTQTYNTFNQYYGNGECGVTLYDINEL